jgi:hypothetical protein
MEAEPRRHPFVAGIALFNAVSAAFGAVGLATGRLSLGDTVTARLPWDSPVFAGIALGAIVALPNAALLFTALRPSARCGPLSILVGVLLVGWIVVESAFIREFSFFQPLFVVIGATLIWLGARIVRRATRTSG